MVADDLVLIDEPRPRVRRLTLNRPEKRNALSNALRTRLFQELRAADADDEVRVMVIRGAGSCFSSGYDLAQDPDEPLTHHTARTDGHWARHLVAGWFEIWDFATPVIAQVHGYCLAGGSELAAACDLVYVADDALIGHPPARIMAPPDMIWQPWLYGLRRAMEALLTGDSITGAEAAQWGFANRAYPAADLEGAVLDQAERISLVPAELLAISKRAVHRSLEVAGMRAGIRAAADTQALAFHQPGLIEFEAKLAENVTAALDQRDAPFGDGRTTNA